SPPERFALRDGSKPVKGAVGVRCLPRDPATHRSSPSGLTRGRSQGRQLKELYPDLAVALPGDFAVEAAAVVEGEDELPGDADQAGDRQLVSGGGQVADGAVEGGKTVIEDDLSALEGAVALGAAMVLGHRGLPSGQGRAAKPSPKPSSETGMPMPSSGVLKTMKKAVSPLESVSTSASSITTSAMQPLGRQRTKGTQPRSVSSTVRPRPGMRLPSGPSRTSSTPSGARMRKSRACRSAVRSMMTERPTLG